VCPKLLKPANWCLKSSEISGKLPVCFLMFSWTSFAPAYTAENGKISCKSSYI